MDNKNPWIKKKGKTVYENPWIRVDEDEVINPGGGISKYGKVHFKNLAIGIIPLDEDKNTWLVGQWRYTLNEFAWEIPMGGGLIGVDPIISAKRELKEETGLSANQWKEVLKIHTSNSVTDELGIVYMAEELTEGETAFDETEKLEILKLPFAEAHQMVLDGRITDGISIAGVLKLGRILGL